MMSIEYIKSINKEKEAEAKNNNLRPIKVFTDGDVDVDKLRNIKHIGDYRPNGFELVNTFFVDSSGLGGADEPAMTFGQLIEIVRGDRYYAIIEAGQFQVYIGEFKKVE